MQSRKVIGLVVLMALLAVYCGICVFIAVQFLPDSKLAELIFYAVAGVIWIFPAMKIVRWMQSMPEVD
ncbi:DUF2842 domain-containing protein [uncultured Sneathiella sp.]|uniref:DUF2842 domain-containing protein n=1 Tax=uncultured Sneathiella sp. TaxID=879315 RepID=UPI0030EC4D38|tara:strand:- start:33880 stop:34083 length:204 start_codon:yes stop_codon:yes gene_type:complete